MLCPHCQKAESKVLDSRDFDVTIRRRRECLSCGFRFTTKEEIDVPRLTIIKKNGTTEPYDRTKITVGIAKACQKRPIKSEQIEDMVDLIDLNYPLNPV